MVILWTVYKWKNETNTHAHSVAVAAFDVVVILVVVAVVVMRYFAFTQCTMCPVDSLTRYVQYTLWLSICGASFLFVLAFFVFFTLFFFRARPIHFVLQQV